MSQPEPVFESAKKYCGDPLSHFARGELIRDFLIEEGMTPDSRVLDVGCGALSQGAPIMRYLKDGLYTGLDPTQWLIRSALDYDISLLGKRPEFLFTSDFDASGPHPYTVVVAHSVLSHVAYWQLSQALMQVRRVTEMGGFWLASLRLDQFTSFHQEWQYPNHSTFRWEDVATVAYQAGWSMEVRHDLKQRLERVAPNDVHDWIKLTASLSPQAANELRLDMEARERETREVQALAQELYADRETKRLEEMSDD